MKGPAVSRFLRGAAAVCAAALLATGLGAGVAAAQLSSEEMAEIEQVRTQIKSDRQALVAANLELTDAEATAFWPVYREYRGELDKVSDRTVKLVGDYASKYNAMTDADADMMMKEWLSIEKAKDSLREKYVKKVGKVLPTKKTVRYFQIENKLDTIMSLGMASQIPLVK